MSSTIIQLLEQNRKIYGIPDDRLYSIEDLLYGLQKFLFRYLEENEKHNKKETIKNLNIALAWFLSLVNRYHLDLEQDLWTRYSYKCPFCLDIPCNCQKIKLSQAKKTGRPASRKPQKLKEWQKMLAKIYSDQNIEEINIKCLRSYEELNYTFRHFLHKKEKKYLQEIKIRTVDFFVLIIRLYNFLQKDLALQFQTMFHQGCYVCHKTPCECLFFV